MVYNDQYQNYHSGCVKMFFHYSYPMHIFSFHHLTSRLDLKGVSFIISSHNQRALFTRLRVPIAQLTPAYLK